jgi:hypothetical protein
MRADESAWNGSTYARAQIMPSRSVVSPQPRRKRKRRSSLMPFWPRAQWRRHWWRKLRDAPRGARYLVVVMFACIVMFLVNWSYQVARKPSELFFPVSDTLYKTPPETWKVYGPLFREHATEVLTPALLAALAQVEGAGNPLARTYWRWSLQPRPFEVYRPASSAVGMYQMTDGTFAMARHYCVHQHVVVEDRPWNSIASCWFNRFYTRTLPSNAIELAAAYLDRAVATTLIRLSMDHATLEQKQDIAAVIHLCGAGTGEIFARRRFRLDFGQRCGKHDVHAYVMRVDQLKKVFARLDGK